MIVTYKERNFIDRFRCIDTERKFYALCKWKPERTSLWYFRVNEFNVRTISESDIISITE